MRNNGSLHPCFAMSKSAVLEARLWPKIRAAKAFRGSARWFTVVTGFILL